MPGRSQGPGAGGAGGGRSSQPRLDNPLPEHFPGRGGGRGRSSGGSDGFTQGASQFPALAQQITSLSSTLTAGQKRSGRGGNIGRGSGASAGFTESPSHFPALVRTNVTSSTILTTDQQPSGRGSGRRRGPGGSAGYTGNTSLSHFPCSSSPSSLLTREVEQLSLENKAATPVQGSVLPVVQAPSPMVQSQPGGEIVQAPPASSKALRIPTRPGFGIVGRKCSVRANHFLVHVGDKDLHHYDISITPEVASKNVCRDIMSKLSKLYRESHLGKRQLAYDGRKSVYTAGPLPFTSNDFVVNLDNASGRNEREFKVIIKFAAKADLHHLQQFLRSRQADVPQETIQALDVVLRDSPSRNYEVIGRSFFHLSFDCGSLDGGLIYWKGFYQSLRPTQMGLSLNIDVSARAFFDPILISEFVLKHFNKDLSRPLSDQDRVKLKRALKGLRVQLDGKEDVKKYKIQGISTKPICELKFSLDKCGTELSVMQYYREKYDTVIKYKNLPALNAGTDAKPVYLPMEVYKIVAGQRYTKKLSEKQVSAMLKATCQRPTERENSIRKIAITNKYEGDDVVKDFAVDVSKELAIIDARVIPPPMLKYHDSGRQKNVSPRIGLWNMIEMKMVNGGRIDFWTFINFSRHKPEMVDRFCQDLVAMCYSKGMAFNCAPVCPIYSADPRNIENVLGGLNEQCRVEWRKKNPEKGLQLLIVILPEISGSYGRIKRICETELGIISQCCQPKNVLKLNKQYMENVALKINVKAGGRNNVLADAVNRRIPLVTDRPTIIIGADVTHPSPGEDSSASIAAVVGSMDWPEITKYRALVSAQNHREEIIQDLYKKEEDAQKGLVHKGMIRELLISFKKTTGYKPHRIIFYRDGVSEGQFNQVLLYEIDAIRKACCSLEENYLPPITFVVVQKRHHTRLFPSNHNDRNATDKSGNILPGTIVESSICHPTEFDFYLCSHSGIQGTSRPTHYHVLYDENKFTSDNLQTLTYNLCYTFARCTRSVSIVPPAYYAHLVAFRARYYVEGDGDSESSSVGIGQATREKNTEIRPLPAIKDNVRDVMFYC